MNHDSLIGQVQNRAKLNSRGEAEVVVRATLQTLEERLSEGDHIEDQLPDEFKILFEVGSQGSMKISS